MQQSCYREIQVKPLSPVIGAEIRGVDIGRATDEALSEIRSAIFENLVIFIPEQDITPAQQVTFARFFGDVPPVPDSMFRVHPDSAYVSVLENDEQRPPTVNNWHSDYSFAPMPDFLSVLLTRVIPAVGGDTIWVNMYAAFEALNDQIKQRLRNLSAVHDYMKLYERPSKRHLWEGERYQQMEMARQQHPPVSHPVVRTIPETRRQALFVNESFTRAIEGLPAKESDALLVDLFDHVRTPEYQLRYQWQPDTLAVWDNRVTTHYAVADYFPRRRLVHRVTVKNNERPSP